ncbi:Uncharacterized protein TPAR_00641 [Tolypocladium paradoxum]|uniref:Pali-domain-containing protein n=1 Tax=Tolypocladium paradoxum TaxID=94208 RepID=A0A2S4L9Q1_9HYPO|nr:Uncharacterized protein TPAR_00641 [Tolypocladium paradoxum]
MASIAGAARRSVSQRSIRVLVSPTPITFAERRSVLQVLEQHGPVEVFRMTPVRFAPCRPDVQREPTTASRLVASSPLSYTIPVARAHADIYIADLGEPGSFNSDPPSVANAQDEPTTSSVEPDAESGRRDLREFTLEIFPAPDYNHKYAMAGSPLHDSWPESYDQDKSFAATTLKPSLPQTVAARGLSHWLFDLGKASRMERKAKRLQLKGWLPIRRFVDPEEQEHQADGACGRRRDASRVGLYAEALPPIRRFTSHTRRAADLTITSPAKPSGREQKSKQFTMGVGTFIHHIGSLLLLLATVLLVVVDVTSPVVNSLAIMKVNLGSRAAGSQVTFGTFGWCHLGLIGGDQCSGAHIGYNPAQVMSEIDGTDFSSAAENTSKGLTRVMVLHPVATGLCFIAFLLCLGTGIVGSLLATLSALLAFVVTVVAMICDFVSFSIIKHDVNDHNRSKAEWGPAIWLMLVAAVLTLFASVIVFVTCCAGRSKKKRESRTKEGWTDPAAATRRRFWQRGGR